MTCLWTRRGHGRRMIMAENHYGRHMIMDGKGLWTRSGY